MNKAIKISTAAALACSFGLGYANLETHAESASPQFQIIRNEIYAPQKVKNPVMQEIETFPTTVISMKQTPVSQKVETFPATTTVIQKEPISEQIYAPEAEKVKTFPTTTFVTKEVPVPEQAYVPEEEKIQTQPTTTLVTKEAPVPEQIYVPDVQKVETFPVATIVTQPTPVQETLPIPVIPAKQAPDAQSVLVSEPVISDLAPVVRTDPAAKENVSVKSDVPASAIPVVPDPVRPGGIMNPYNVASIKKTVKISETPVSPITGKPRASTPKKNTENPVVKAPASNSALTEPAQPIRNESAAALQKSDESAARHVLPDRLPKTGEASQAPIYMLGMMLIAFGAGIGKWAKVK